MRAAPISRSSYSAGTVTASMSARAPATSTPVGPPPTITKFKAPRLTSFGSRSTCSKRPRIRDRRLVAFSSEYSGNECSAAPGVWKKFGCEPAARTSASAAHSFSVRRAHGLGRRVHGGDLGELDVDVVLVGEYGSQRVRDVAGRQERGRDLVEQRLELVVVVLVEQRGVHVIVLRLAPGHSRDRRSRHPRSRRDACRRPNSWRHLRRPAAWPMGLPGGRAGGRRRAGRWPSP